MIAEIDLKSILVIQSLTVFDRGRYCKNFIRASILSLTVFDEISNLVTPAKDD